MQDSCILVKMQPPCSAFRKSDLQPCKKYARNEHHTCSSHRNFYTKANWTKLFFSLGSPFLPTGLDYPETCTVGRIQAAITFALENNLVVLTEEDCATIACPSPQRFHIHQRNAVDLWTILVRSGKVNPRWNAPLTKFAIFTFAMMRTPLVLDIAPSLQDRLGAFLHHPSLEPHKILENVLAYLFCIIRDRGYPESFKEGAYQLVIHEFTDHPSFKGSLFLANSSLTGNLDKIPSTLITKEKREFLQTLLINTVNEKRKDAKAFHHNYVETFKEELVMKVFHPTKVSRWLDEGGFELLDMMF